MAMTVDTHAIVVPAGQLVIAGFFRCSGDHGAGFGGRFAGDRVNRSAQHYAQEQQQGYKASSAAKGKPTDHREGLLAPLRHRVIRFPGRPKLQPLLPFRAANA
jgi:hypothetical protein